MRLASLTRRGALLAASAIDYASMEPDYNAVVTLEATSAPAPA